MLYLGNGQARYLGSVIHYCWENGGAGKAGSYPSSAGICMDAFSPIGDPMARARSSSRGWEDACPAVAAHPALGMDSAGQAQKHYKLCLQEAWAAVCHNLGEKKRVRWKLWHGRCSDSLSSVPRWRVARRATARRAGMCSASSGQDLNMCKTSL